MTEQKAQQDPQVRAPDQLPPEDIARAQPILQSAMTDELPELCERVLSGEKLSDDDVDTIAQVTERAVSEFLEAEDKQESST